MRSFLFSSPSPPASNPRTSEINMNPSGADGHDRQDLQDGSDRAQLAGPDWGGAAAEDVGQGQYRWQRTWEGREHVHTNLQP